MAETYRTRPSALLAIADPWAAYCLDEALYLRLRLDDAQGEGDDADRGTRRLGLRPGETVPLPAELLALIPEARDEG